MPVTTPLAVAGAATRARVRRGRSVGGLDRARPRAVARHACRDAARTRRPRQAMAGGTGTRPTAHHSAVRDADPARPPVADRARPAPADRGWSPRADQA